MTGLATFVPGEFISKQIEIMQELVSTASKIAILANPSNPIHKRVIAEELPQTIRKLGITLPVVEATTAEELDLAFASAASQHVDAMIVFGDALISRNSARTTELATKHRLPAMYLGRQYATDGGLISYSPDFPDFWRRAGGYVDKILKGIEPSDLPVEQPTKFELVINLKTAKALDIIVPPRLLARADEVIE
jgi:putative ABC transport system substrate-binding protein